MENVCKIRLIIIVCFLSVETPIHSQNYYRDCTDYFNMDTTRIVFDERLSINGLDILDTIPNIYLDNLHNIFKSTLNIPLLSIIYPDLYWMIDTSLSRSLSDGSFLKPDTSGFFVRITFQIDSLMDSSYCIKVDPTSNYYMYDALFLPRRYLTINTIGCFFYNSILCIIGTCCTDDFFDGHCYWLHTNSFQKINIYQSEIEYNLDYYGPVSFFPITKCKPNAEQQNSPDEN